MKTAENGVLEASNLYFYSPSPLAQKLYFYPVSAGHFYCNENYSLKRNTFESIFVTYILDGSFTFACGGKDITARKGEVVVLNCYEPHEYKTNDYLESVWLHIAGQNSVDYYNEIVKNEGNIIRCSDPEHVKKLLFRLIEKISSSDRPSESDMSLDIYKLLFDLQNTLHISTNNNLSYEDSVQDAKKYIAERLGEELTVEAVAEHINMSKSHFSRIFKQQTGFSPYEFILASRLNKAKDYLQKTDLTVSQIAFEVGFNSSANFIYFFKQNTGLSPNKFRSFEF